MKTKILAFGILVVFSTFSFAQAPALEKSTCNVDVQLTAENLIVVRYLNGDNDKIAIKVYNADNEFVSGKKVSAQGNIKISYDLKNLPEGDYSFKVFCNKRQICSEVVSKMSDSELSIPKSINGVSTDLNTEHFTQN